MARPQKTGLDYFPLDVQLDEKFELIEAKHEIIGFAVIIKLFQKIYSNGYFINVTEESILLFSKRINVNINTVNVIINDCIKYSIFDSDMYDKYKILTSCGIQKRFIEACSRRKNVELISNYLINVDINSINTDIFHIKEGISTQSKVKNIKVKEIKTKTIEFDFKKSLINLGIDLNIVDEWLKIRKSKKASNSEIAFNAIKKEIEKSNLPANKCIEIAVIKSWRGFESNWLDADKEKTNGSNVPKKLDYAPSSKDIKNDPDRLKFR